MVPGGSVVTVQTSDSRLGGLRQTGLRFYVLPMREASWALLWEAGNMRRDHMMQHFSTPSILGLSCEANRSRRVWCAAEYAAFC